MIRAGRNSLTAKIGDSDHPSPEISHLNKKIAYKYLTIEPVGQNIPSGYGHHQRFSQ
jgi:hypothetical protein